VYLVSYPPRFQGTMFMGEVEVPSSAGQFEIDIAAALFTTSGDACSLNDVRSIMQLLSYICIYVMHRKKLK